ncbi:hypothetical protein LEN26_009343 [Aphanomyces euteiches]|nr:hypothetical protein LEN26_009343 [Aphanomyces euteiches]
MKLKENAKFSRMAMWKKVLGGLSAAETRNTPRYATFEDELDGEMKSWWQPLQEAIAGGKIHEYAPVQEFLRKSALMNEEAFAEEYREIRNSVEGAPWFQAALTPQTAATKEKNRYRDVLPFEKTRVRLRPQTNDPAGDYINANFIFEDQYIACCAPTPNAIVDFWSMVWYENVHVILMLTNFVERQMLKADMYWDTKGQIVDVGEITIQLKQVEVSSRGYTIRTIELTHRSLSTKRTLYHVQLTTWPDHGVLQDFGVIQPMLRLVNGLNQRNRCESDPQLPRPIVVHCSAGIGRSGTFIAIDTILKQLREAATSLSNPDTAERLANALNIRSIVHRLRCQRPGMVQTTEQYQMIYEYIRAVLAGQS